MGPLLGHGIFNTDGAPWKFHRSMSRPFFATEKIRHFKIFDKHADDAVGRVRDRLREGVPIDIQVWPSHGHLIKANGEHGIGRRIKVLLGLRHRIPVWHERLFALRGPEVSPRTSIQRTGAIAPIQFVCGSIPWGSRSRITEVPL